MNVYVDKDFSPRDEAGAAEFDKYVQTSDQEGEEADEEEQEQDDDSESDRQFDPKTEV